MDIKVYSYPVYANTIPVGTVSMVNCYPARTENAPAPSPAGRRIVSVPSVETQTRRKNVAHLRLRGRCAAAPSVHSLLIRPTWQRPWIEPARIKAQQLPRGNHRSDNRADRHANRRNGAPNRRVRATAALFAIRATINLRLIRPMLMR
jgi:hypothetical protein